MSGGEKAKLEALEECLEGVTKKRKTSYTKKLALIDSLLEDINHTKALVDPERMETEGEHSVGKHLSELNQRVKSKNILKGIQTEHKEYHAALSKYGKLIDKSFISDLSKTLPEHTFDNEIINQIIAQHLFRQGKFTVGEEFVKEANVQVSSSLREPFQEMYQILDEMVTHRNLVPAVEWARKRRKELEERDDTLLEFKLHKLQYLHYLKNNQAIEALQYARHNLAPFVHKELKEIEKMMGCLCYIGRLETSPYASFVESLQWSDVSHDFTSTCCSLLGLSYESPLYTVVSAGAIALPQRLKVAARLQGNEALSQTVEVELGDDLQFHPIFACPVSREQSTPDNPPMLLSCGHVIAKASMTKLTRGGTRFKCPYCPTEQVISKAMQVTF